MEADRPSKLVRDLEKSYILYMYADIFSLSERNVRRL